MTTATTTATTMARLPVSLIDLFDATVARHAARPLFLTKTAGRWVETTYGEFAQLVEAVRGGLAGLGVGPGDAVGIISANRLEWATVAYASYGLRAAVVPMYESQREAGRPAVGGGIRRTTRPRARLTRDRHQAVAPGQHRC
jgi:long-chain acyl-CoA synthetase